MTAILLGVIAFIYAADLLIKLRLRYYRRRKLRAEAQVTDAVPPQ